MLHLQSKAALVALLFTSCVGALPKGVAAHPQGLLPSQDTATTPSGYLELEAIGSWADTEDQTMAVIRYGLASQTEVYLAQDLHHAINDPLGPNASGIGDVWIGMRHRIIEEDSGGVAHAVAAEVRIPHGDPDLGISASGLELHVAHVRDGSWGALSWTTNTDLFFLADEGGRPDPALGGSFTLTGPLLQVAGKRLPLALLAELGALSHPEEDDMPAWIAVGLRIPVHPSLEIQTAWVKGLGSDGPEDRWVLNLGRLVGDALDLGSR